MRLSGKIAIVTGGASGIGRESSILFATEGATVAVVDIDAEGAQRTVSAIASAGDCATAYFCDVSDPSSVEDTIDDLLGEFGRVDVLFNNAGIVLSRDVIGTEPDEWDRVLAVNVRSVYLMMRAVIPAMKERRAGSIINTASGVGLRPRPNLAAYCASKGAVIALSKAAASEVGEDGIRVNALCPGMIDTAMNRAVIDSDAEPTEALARMLTNYPLGRMGEAEEVARAALFLASDESSYVTGTAMAVDGGRTLH